MIPVYTHYLSPADYGILELLDMTITVITMLIGLRLGSALIRFYHSYDTEKDRQEVFSTNLIFIVSMTIIVVLILEIFVTPFSKFILGNSDYFEYLQIMFLAMGLQTIATVPQNLLLAKFQSVQYATITIVTFVSYLTLNILFLVVFGWGLMGLLYSILITKIFNNIMLFFVVRRHLKLSFSMEKLKSMVKFSYPLIPASLAMFSIHFSDRFFVQHFCDPDELGVYSLGYKFGMIISVIVSQPFFRIWNTQRFEIAKQNNPGPTLSSFFSYYALIILTAGLTIGVFSDEVVKIMAPDSYARASNLIVVIVLSYVFSGMATFFTLGTMLVYKTKHTAYIQVSIAILNVFLNILFIPSWGIMGAAFSTVLTFFMLWIVTMLNSQRLYYLPLELRRLGSLSLVVVITYCASWLIDQSLIISLGINTLLMLNFPVLLWLLGFFQFEELAKAKELLVAFKYRLLQISSNSSKSY